MSNQPWEYAEFWWDTGVRAGFPLLPKGKEDEDEKEGPDSWVSFSHHDTWDLPAEADFWDVLRHLGEAKEQLGFRTTAQKRR